MNNKIKYTKGNIFTSKCQTLVNTVNCVGVMGAGIALEFKYRYPEMFGKYAKYCEDKLIEIGKLWVYDIPNSTQKVLNFPTKFHWKYPSKYEYLEKGLKKFAETYNEKGITSIAFPMLGTFNGGLDTERVLDLMYQYLKNCDIPIEIYEYDFDASDDLIECFRDAFAWTDLEDIEKITGIKKNALNKIKDGLKNPNLKSLIQINKIKGIGEETVSACFQFAINLKTSSKESLKKSFSNSNMQEQKIVKVPDKTKSEKFAITLAEKLTLTGLDEQTILKIENKEEEISIKALKTYCNALKLSFTDFISKNYTTTSR